MPTHITTQRSRSQADKIEGNQHRPRCPGLSHDRSAINKGIVGYWPVVGQAKGRVLERATEEERLLEMRYTP